MSRGGRGSEAQRPSKPLCRCIFTRRAYLAVLDEWHVTVKMLFENVKISWFSEAQRPSNRPCHCIFTRRAYLAVLDEWDVIVKMLFEL